MVRNSAICDQNLFYDPTFCHPCITRFFKTNVCCYGNCISWADMKLWHCDPQGSHDRKMEHIPKKTGRGIWYKQMLFHPLAATLKKTWLKIWILRFLFYEDVFQEFVHVHSVHIEWKSYLKCYNIVAWWLKVTSIA